MQKLFVESHLPVTPEVAWDVFESEPFPRGPGGAHQPRIAGARGAPGR
ncbi:MAG: hypothetical protein H6734_06055 [Alphaproteobacteria bacterium]|nr:hypothetical protein [Alphaproteobacteria bacterium]